MSTAFPAQVPPELLAIIDQYVSKRVSELAEAAQLANAPKVLTPHEQLQFHVARAVACITGDQSPVAVNNAHIHTLSAISLLVKEVEDLGSASAVTTPVPVASVDTTPAVTPTVTEGAI